jgi:hypothetical protein
MDPKEKDVQEDVAENILELLEPLLPTDRGILRRCRWRIIYSGVNNKSFRILNAGGWNPTPGPINIEVEVNGESIATLSPNEDIIVEGIKIRLHTGATWASYYAYAL